MDINRPTKTRYENNFGFLRLLLSVLVVFQHAVLLADGNMLREPLFRLNHSIGLGTAAVYGFFTLSGYLITQSWANRPKLGTFLRNRILRIYPGFLAAALFTILVVGRLGADASYFSKLSPSQIVKCLLTLQIPAQLPAFPSLPLAGVLNQSLWTIPIEFACYLAVAIAGVTRMLSLRRIWPAIFVVSLLLPASQVAAFLAPWLRADLVSLVSRFFQLWPPFVAGICLYLYRDRVRYTPAGVAIAAVVLLAGLTRGDTGYAALAVAGSYLVFALGFADVPALRGIGERVDLSYGIYLYHWPCQLVWLWYAPGLSPWLLFPLSLAAAATLACASWFLVKQPLLRFKRAKSAHLGSNPQPESATSAA